MSRTIIPLAMFGWLLTPFVSGMLVARSARARAAVADHLVLCLTIGWAGVAALMWGATALEHPGGIAAFVAGGPIGGLSFWGRSSDDDGGDDPPDDDPEPQPPGWDWDRFGRDLADYDRDRLGGSR